MEENIVLCAANRYTRKYYFNPDFSVLPKRVQNELQIMCVVFTEEVGGILSVEYDREGNLELKTEAAETDAMYDEIEAGLKIRELREEKQELFEALEMFYRVFRQGKTPEES